MTRIPLDPIGYSVNVGTGTIHTRYAGDHAGTAYRTRTAKGVLTLLDGKPGNVCAVCYGKTPRYPDTTPRPIQQRRLPSQGGGRRTPGSTDAPSVP